MNRKEELLNEIQNNPVLLPLINDMVYLEKQMEYFRALPMLKIHPEDPSIQKATPSSKLYKECLQQYTNIVRIIMRATGAEAEEDDGPLTRWLNEHIDSE